MAKTPRPLDPFEAIAAELPTFEEEAAPTLRQQSLRDPLPGTPMHIQILPGAEDTPVPPGAWGGAEFNLAHPASGLPPKIPVTPLGMDGQTAYFLNTMGAVVELDAKSSGKGPIGALFAGRSRYLEWAWPRFDRKHISVVGWEADDARQALFDAAAYRGYFAPEDQVRGRGCWRDDDGGLIYHAGDQVLIGGKWRPCGVYGKHIYPARTKIGRPTGRAQPAGPDGAGQILLATLESFSWERGGLDARLTLGWLMTAKLGGALDRRPVLFCTGPEGSGKSTLHGLMRCVMVGALVATSNTTQAGIFQRLQNDSIAIMVDELESKEDTRVVDRILELARICYSADKMQRGGKDGVGKEFTLSSSFMGSSIAKPATDAQDDSRMVVTNLRERAGGGPKLIIDTPDVEQIGRDLLRRAFDAWPRWDDTVNIFRDLMIEMGHTDRAADTFAPLAAGSHIALSDEVPDAAALNEWRAWLKPAELTETASREKSWQRCWWHMLGAQPDALRVGKSRSAGAAITWWRDGSEGMGVSTDAEQRSRVETVQQTLAACGLALSWPKGFEERFELARLFVPLNSPALHALFSGSIWAGKLGAPGPWSGVLRQMPPELWKLSTCDRLLNRAAKGLMIDLPAVLALFDGES